jgi:hypothetical protein
MKIGQVAMEVAGRVGMVMKKTRHVVVVVVVTIAGVEMMMELQSRRTCACGGDIS